MPKISVHDLMTICWVLLLLIGQNDINPKLFKSIVASICKVMAVKKPCVKAVVQYKTGTCSNPSQSAFRKCLSFDILTQLAQK